ncbi:hypothetical protein E3O42_16780 [Cryobacterium adonitolivorans]|uniref:Pilus assembly protein PilO n=1 Tax=Cryobacterium adonitolivorans TaxID=1259189 RepID=A0A4R8W178_9MICO|nr:hypothetical protein [Cryobacterium adonitolivorans]TFB96793.1 hypothetical protein E3O42_16780 [Cryobacterium adonitolivorans]
MDKNRIWAFGAALAIAATAILGWTLGISPKLNEAKAAEIQRAVVETQNIDYESQLATLQKQFDNIGDLKSDLAALQLAVPNAAEIPAFVTQLDTIGRQRDVTLTGIIVNDAQSYVPVVVAPPAAAAAPAAEVESTETTGAGVSATEAVTVPPTPAELAASLAPSPSPLVTAANFVSVPITVNVEGSYGDVLEFIDGLQKGTRLALVTTFSTKAAAPVAIAPNPEVTVDDIAPIAPERVAAQISALIYVLIDPADPIAAG